MPSATLRSVAHRGRRAPAAPADAAWAVSPINSSSVNVTWTAPPAGVTEVVVKRDGVQVFAGLTSPFVDSGLSSSGTYTYQLFYSASGLLGLGSNTKQVTMAAAPPPMPADAAWDLTVLSPTSVSVSWDPPPPGVTDVLVFRGTDPSYSPVHTSGLTSPWVDSPLPTNAVYDYVIFYRAGSQDSLHSTKKSVTLGTPPVATGLAFPRGPVSGNAQAADFYDSVGIGHHPEYLYFNAGNSTGALDDTAITRMQQLGIRHVRLGMYSPANYGSTEFFHGSGRFGNRIAARNASRGGNQPIAALWGTTEEVAYEAQRFGDSAVYTISNTGGTWLRPLDGPAGSVATRRGFTDTSVDLAHQYPTTRGLDDFHRTEGTSVGANWINDPFGEGTPGAVISPTSPFGERDWSAGAGGQSTMYWNPATYATRIDARAFLRQRATSAGSWVRVGIISTPGASTADGYLLEVDTSVSTPVWNLYRYDDGARTQIGSATGVLNASVGVVADRIGLDLRNGTLTAYRFNDSNKVWSAVLTVSDSTYTFAAGGARLVLGSKDTTSNAFRLRFFGGSTALLENGGNYYNQGWITAAGLQGANEPDTNRSAYWPNLRIQFSQIKNAKNARTTRDVLAGASYIDSTTGRITPGPAKAPQLPAVAAHFQDGGYGAAGNLSTLSDVGCVHVYWGGHGPDHTEMDTKRTRWRTSYPAGMPMFVTETGYYQRSGYDGGNSGRAQHPGWAFNSNDGQRFCPPEVSGEYMMRCALLNYAEYGCRRTYLYKLCDENTAIVPPWNFGMCDLSFNPRASFFQVQNLLKLVGFVQAPTSTPITVTNNFTPSANETLGAGDSWVGHDHLTQLVLQRDTNEYLIILSRHREIWNRFTQAYQTPDFKDVTLTIPGHTIAVAEAAEPSKCTVQAAAAGATGVIDPVDGQAYANPGDGLAYAPLTHTNTTINVRMAGLVRVVRVLLDVAAPATPPTGFTATPGAAGQVNLTWGAPSTAADSFFLERKQSWETVWGNAVTVAGSSTSLTVSGLTGGETTEFRLQSVVGTDRSSFVTASAAVSSPAFTTLSQTFDANPPWPELDDFGSGSVFRTQGMLNIDTITSYPTIATVGTYDLTNSSVFVQAVQVPQLAGSYCSLALRSKLTLTNWLQIEVDHGTTLAFVVTTGGVQDVTSITYDPVAHAFWRISNSGGNVRFETSPDGTAWNTRRTVATPWPVTSMYATMWSGYDTGIQPQPALFDNLNTLTTATAPITNFQTAGSNLGGDARAFLDWGTITGATGYLIYADGSLLATVTPGSANQYNTPQPSGSTRNYSIRAYRNQQSRGPMSIARATFVP